MFEIADRLLAAADAGRTLAVATAVSIEGSAPRTVGTSMAFDGTAVIGSIAGGCVEGAVVETCQAVLDDGIPRTVDYGIDDETAFGVGLTCGGRLRIHSRMLDASLAADLRARHAIVSVVECADAEPELFVEHPTAAPWLLVFGAMEFSSALSSAAQLAGFRVTVCDPRPLFATAERFPGAELTVRWPTEYLESVAGDVDDRTAVCVLSHDARFDAELIAHLLMLPAAYVGAMGSRVTHDRRVASLIERGTDAAALARLHSPIGLDLGASTPGETAIAILAEILQARAGATGRPLAELTGAIHAPGPEVSARARPSATADPATSAARTA